MCVSCAVGAFHVIFLHFIELGRAFCQYATVTLSFCCWVYLSLLKFLLLIINGHNKLVQVHFHLRFVLCIDFYCAHFYGRKKKKKTLFKGKKKKFTLASFQTINERRKKNKETNASLMIPFLRASNRANKNVLDKRSH